MERLKDVDLARELDAVIPKVRKRISSADSASREAVAGVLMVTALDLCDEESREPAWDLYEQECYELGEWDKKARCYRPGRWVPAALLRVALNNLKSGVLRWDELEVACHQYLCGRGGERGFARRWALESREEGSPRAVRKAG